MIGFFLCLLFALMGIVARLIKSLADARKLPSRCKETSQQMQGNFLADARKRSHQP